MKANTILLHAQKAQLLADEIEEMQKIIVDDNINMADVSVHELIQAYHDARVALIQMSCSGQAVALRIALAEQERVHAQGVLQWDAGC